MDEDAVGPSVRAAILDADQALAAIVGAQQVTWSSGAAALYRAALCDAAVAVRHARAASEHAVGPVAALDAS